MANNSAIIGSRSLTDSQWQVMSRANSQHEKPHSHLSLSYLAWSHTSHTLYQSRNTTPNLMYFHTLTLKPAVNTPLIREAASMVMIGMSDFRLRREVR